ncbi:MAG: hypothetical protein HY246_00420 [Proteobacteria bacterium]|nr:hypothetical protein [Pseudomonadota bacterium]
MNECEMIDVLSKMAKAGEAILSCYRILAKTGDNVVGETLRGSKTFIEWEHYPENDAYDPETHAQYYYHAHPPELRPFKEHGHFHLFLRPKGMRPGTRPVSLADHAPSNGETDALSHLVAISMDEFGYPKRLFTTNRWVTGETWYAASDVIDMIDRFVVEVARPNLLVNTWITAMVQLFRPLIIDLIIERDAALARWRSSHPDENVFEDRHLEITSIANISVKAQIAKTTAALKTVR